MPSGTANLEPAFYRPIVAALDEDPRLVRELLALPKIVGRSGNPAELAGVLVGTDQAMPVGFLPEVPDARAVRFNRVAAQQLVRADNLNRGVALAGGGLGGALPCQVLDLHVYDRLQEAEGQLPDTVAWAAPLTEGRATAERDRLRAFLDRILEERVPVWRRARVL